MPETKPLNLLVIGAGDRGNLFGEIAVNYGARIVAVADISEKMRELMAEKHDIPIERMFPSGTEALESKLPFDAVYIASPDKTHYKLAIKALKENYNVLLEKPMATTPKQCTKLIKAQEKSKKALMICHVLRYAPFFQKIKEITDSREIGNIKTINLIEDVAYWHFAHSYVRGNWAKESTSSPIILAKSCHDLDIIAWLSNSKPKKVISTGKLTTFKKENAPKTSTDRCIDCPIKDCLYDSRKFYLNHKPPIHWPYKVISPEDTSEEGRLEAIKTGPYGKCVFKCDNDVVDNQDVIIEFENDITANFSLRFGGEKTTRKIFIQFERGELSGDLNKGKINVIKYTGRRNEAKKEEIDTQERGGHGGGDAFLVKDFFDIISSQSYENSLTSAQKSLQSHLLAFAAEKSRKTGKLGKVINYSKYLDSLVTTPKKSKKKKKSRRKKKKRKKKKKKKSKKKKKK